MRNNIILLCQVCNNSFSKKEHHYKEALKFKWNMSCSLECQSKFRSKKKEVQCKQCDVSILKTHAELNPKGNDFCSKSCAATYNNTHKTKGTRISKLEKYIREELTKEYLYLDIHYNQKDAINSELDIYIPSLKLAFELNGIFHYEPIYGADKLMQIKNNDNRKMQACLERNIELCIIDASTLSYFKKDKALKYYNIIKDVICLKQNAGKGI